MCFKFFVISKWITHFTNKIILQNKLWNNKKNLIEKKHKIKWWQNLSDTFAFKNFMAPFYRWDSTASRLESLQGGSLLFTTKFPEIPGILFYRPRKDEKLSRPWSNSVVLNTGPLDWESSTLATRPLLHDLNNIFWMLTQWWKSRIKWHKMYGSKNPTGPKEKAKLH